MTTIQRKLYLSPLIGLLGRPVIKVIVGQRRSGKSILMKQLVDHVGSQKSIYINFEYYPDRQTYSDKDVLYARVKEQLHEDISLLCIDEVQEVDEREKVVVSLWSEFPELDIFVTGSNSTLMSGQLTTLLRGRYIEKKVYPFSYDEYCHYFGLQQNRKSLKSFLEVGGYAGCYPFDDYTQRRQWVTQMIDATMLRDVIERYRIRNSELFREIFLYIASVSGSLVNISNIHKALINKGYSVNFNSVQQYTKYMEESFMIYACELYDLHGKKLFDRNKKYYLSDHSVRGYVFSDFDRGRGKVIENMLYMELKKAGYTVYTGKKGAYEVDFVAQKEGKTIYIQVAYVLEQEETIARELEVFSHIQDNRPKYLVSMSDLPSTYSRDGYQHIHARELGSILK